MKCTTLSKLGRIVILRINSETDRQMSSVALYILLLRHLFFVLVYIYIYVIYNKIYPLFYKTMLRITSVFHFDTNISIKES
jgi:hypothetical protein